MRRSTAMKTVSENKLATCVALLIKIAQGRTSKISLPSAHGLADPVRFVGSTSVLLRHASANFP